MVDRQDRPAKTHRPYGDAKKAKLEIYSYDATVIYVNAKLGHSYMMGFNEAHSPS